MYNTYLGQNIEPLLKNSFSDKIQMKSKDMHIIYSSEKKNLMLRAGILQFPN